MEYVSKKRHCKSKRVEKGSDDNKKSKEKDKLVHSDFERYITYDVLRIILKHLNARDLASAAMVCRSWSEAAVNERKTRLWPDLFMMRCQSKLDIKHYPGKQLASNVQVRPRLGLLFTSSERLNGWFNHLKRDCQCSYVPPSCDIITLGNYGCILDKTEVEEDDVTVSCLFLPEVANIKIAIFSFDEDGIQGIPLKLSQLFCNRNIKCLMLFSNTENFFVTEQITTPLIKKSANKNVIIWGGVSNDITICTKNFDGEDVCGRSLSLVGIAFYGSGIATWSVIIESHLKTKEQVESKLNELKADVKLRKYSVGFMFACCGRGLTMYRERHVESTIFKKVFPTVPLIGSFGGGEFGRTMKVNDYSQETIKHELSTVFMILTYG